MNKRSHQPIIDELKVYYTILHVGTNDLNSDKPSHVIAKSTVDLAMTLKNSSQNVSVFNIIKYDDNFNEKAIEAYGYLKQFCIGKNILLINHTKRIHSRNINRSYISTSPIVLF